MIQRFAASKYASKISHLRLKAQKCDWNSGMPTMTSLKLCLHGVPDNFQEKKFRCDARKKSFCTNAWKITICHDDIMYVCMMLCIHVCYRVCMYSVYCSVCMFSVCIGVKICHDDKQYATTMWGITFFLKSYHPIPWRDSISRPIAPISSVAGGDDHSARVAMGC
jgi:hypothetical protein